MDSGVGALVVVVAAAVIDLSMHHAAGIALDRRHMEKRR